MYCITLFALLPLAACICMGREACMDSLDLAALDGPISAQALLQVWKKEAYVTLQGEQVGNKHDDFYSFITKIVEQRHQGATEGIGSEVSLDEEGYQKVKAECCNLEMMFFVRRVIDEVLSLEVCNEGGLSGFVPWFTCETNAQKSFQQMLDELRRSVPPINCAFLASKGKCGSIDFTQCHGVENKDQYKECEDDITIKTTTRRPIPLDCTPLNKGEVCVGNGPHGDMGSITTLCACDCLQCESIKGRRCLLKDCIDLNLVESTKCTPTWPGQAGTCVADQHDNGTSFCVVPVPEGCPPVSLHTTTTTTTATLDCSPINSGEVCVGSGPGHHAKTTLCTCDCELCEAKLKMLGEHRPCISSDCLNLHLTNAEACTPKWPGDNGICEADLESNTSSFCKVPLPPGCLVPTPPPGTTTTTSPSSCDPLNQGQVCMKAGGGTTAFCQCDCIACHAKKGDDCTADDCLKFGFFDVSKCNPVWPGADGTCDVAVSHCEIPVPAGCPPVVIPPSASTTLGTTKPATTPEPPTTTTTTQVTSTEQITTTTALETTQVTTSTTTTSTITSTTTSLDCTPIDGNKGFIVYSDTLCHCDCIKCRQHLPLPGATVSIADSSTGEARTLYSPVFDCDAATCADLQQTSNCTNYTNQIEATPYCHIEVPEGCPQPPHENVSCGGHTAVSCPECGDEPGQCNGDCTWVMSKYSDAGGDCYPHGPYVDNKLKCGDGKLTDNCELCSEDACRSSPYEAGYCVMAWQENADDEMTEQCVRFPQTNKCDGLHDRYSYSDCTGCAGGGLYGYWEPHNTLGYYWQADQADANNTCYEKASTPSPCAPLDPTDTGRVCDLLHNSWGHCKCDCNECRKYLDGPCTIEWCEAMREDTGFDFLTCNRTDGWLTEMCGGDDGFCKVAVPEGCPQPYQEPVNCGSFTAIGCAGCVTGDDYSGCDSTAANGDCYKIHIGSGIAGPVRGCYPRGNAIEASLAVCGDGSKAKGCKNCPVDTCQPGNSGTCTLSTDGTVCE